MAAQAQSDDQIKADWLSQHHVTKCNPAPARGIDWRVLATTVVPSPNKHPITNEEEAIAADAALGAPRISPRGIRKEREIAQPYWAINGYDIRRETKAAQDGDKDALARLIARYNESDDPKADDQLTRKAARDAILSYDLETPHDETLFGRIRWAVECAIQERRFGPRMDVAHYREETYAEFSRQSRMAVGANLSYLSEVARARDAGKLLPWDVIIDQRTRTPFDFWPDRARDYVEGLPARDRAIIHGLYRDGLWPSEIAEYLGVSQSAVSKRVPILKGDLVSRFGLLVFHDEAPIVEAKRLRAQVQKKTVKRNK